MPVNQAFLSSGEVRNAPRTRWRIVLLAAAAGVIAAMQIGKLPPAITPLRDELAIGLIAAGWIISCFNAISALLGAVAGIVADHIGQRRSLLAGLGCLALGGLAGSFAADGTELLLTRLVEGMGFVAVVIAAPSLINAVSLPRDRNLTIALWSTYMPAGIALMMLLTPPLLNALGWRGLWFTNVGLIAVFVMLFARVSRPLRTVPGAIERRLSDVRRALIRPGPWLLGACFASYSLQWFAVMAWLPTFLAEQAGYTATRAAITVALVVACNIPGNLLGGWLLRRGLPRWGLIAAANSVLGIIAIAIFAESVPVAWKIVLAFAFSTLGGLIPSSVLAGVPAHAPTPAQIGVTNGIIVQGSNTGSLLGPPLFAAAVTALGGWHQAGWLLFVSGCIGAGLAGLLRGVEQRYRSGSCYQDTP